MSYIVLCDNRADGLMSQVADHLDNGWQLQGGISVSPIDDAKYLRGTLLYSQAMTLVSRVDKRDSPKAFLSDR